MANTKFDIREMMSEDWPNVKRIYRQGIETGIATFETEVPDWQKWNNTHLDHSRLVAEGKKSVVGWAALSAVSDRCVYGGVAEVSVYVASNARGEGAGTVLLKALIEKSEQNGIWTLQAGILHENKGSIHMLEKCGFQIVGRRDKLGCLHGEWKDVMLMERRSKAVG